MGKKIAKFGATGAQAIGTDIWKVLATISIGRVFCFFLNGENCEHLKYLILLISGMSEKGGKIAEYSAKGAQVI